MATAAELAIVLKAKDEASAVLKKVSAQVGDLGKSGAAANKGLGSLTSGFKSAVAAAAGIATAAVGVTALAGAVKGAVGSAIDFEQSMSGIKAVSGATGQQMQQLSALALDLGKSTAFSAKEAAGGIEELVKGGVSIGDIFGGAASAALDLAAAGGVSVAEAATIASNAMNQFNLKGSDMAHVADLVAGAANASSISVSDFNQSLAAGGSVAAMAGQSIDSFATAVALMGAQGIKGSDAGTSLKAAINNLIPTTDIAKNKMRELGIITADGTNQFINASGGMKSFGEIAEVLQTQTAGLTESQRLLALELIFGSDGMRAAGVLAKEGGEGFDEMAGAMLAAGGAAAIARERLNNAAGDIEELKGSVETAAIIVGSLFVPAVRSIATAATGAVNTAIDEFNTLRATAQNIAGAHGIGMIPAAITAVENRIREVFGDTAAEVFHNFVETVEGAGRAFAAAKTALDPFAAAFADWVHGSLQGSPETTQRLADAMNNLADAMERHPNLIRGLATGAAALVAVLGTAGLLGVVARLAVAVGGLVSPFGLATAATVAWAAAYGAGVTGVVQITDFLTGTIGALPKLFGDSFAQNTEAIRRWFQESQGAFAGVVGAVQGMAAAVGGAIVALAGQLGVSAQDVGVAIIQGIASGLNPAVLVASLIGAVKGAIDQARGVASAESQSVGANIITGIVNGITGGIGRVTAAATGMAQRAISAAMARLQEGSPSKVFEEIGENVDAGFIQGVEGMASEVEAAVEGVMDGAAEAAQVAAEDGFAGLATALGAQFEKTFTLVEQAQNKIDNARDQAIRQSQRATELAERQHQRRLVDLEAELGSARGDARAKVLEKITRAHEDAARKVEDIEARLADTLDEIAFDAADNLAAAAEKQALLAGEALRDFQRGVEEVQRDTARAAEAISRKAGEAVSDAMADAADAIMEAKDRAAEAIAELEANQTLSRDIRGRRDAFSEGQDEASREFSEKREDADLEYRLTKDLEKAKLKLGKDRAKAETEEERRQADIRYAESVEDLRQGFEDAKADLRRRRQLEEQERAFRKQQQQALQAFNDALEDEALKRQVKRIQDERDSRIKEINAALDEKIAAVRRNEKEENEALRRSADEKLNDLRTRFYDKVGALNQDSKDKFEALFASIKKGVDDAAKAANDLAEAINRVATTKMPGAAAGGGGGATWANQTQAVRDSFTATWGADAQRQWELEHNQELVAMMGGSLPGPTGRDPISGLPTGPGYFEPVPDTPYWRENADRFNPLPYGTEYPPAAFYGSDQNSRDLFGGNNTYSEDAYATGGMVPGPTGAARLATVHGGEGVFTPDQLAALARYGGGGGGGGDAGYWAHGHDIVLDGVVVGRAVEPYVSGAQDSAVRLGLG